MKEIATAKKLTNNHLTCVICTEVFTDPATLQCDHTFCKSCLLRYTKTQTETIQEKSIPCPSCSQKTEVTNADSPVEEWVSQLKPSHVIQNLMDDLVGSPDAGVCSVCKEDGPTNPGTMWCTTCADVFCDACLKFHKKLPLSLNHKVLDLRSKKPNVRSFTCQFHKDVKIKLFCKDCRMSICTVCKHRIMCDNVETIDVMMPVVKEALVNETRIYEKKIQTRSDNISWTNSKIEKLSTSAQEMKDQVRKARMTAIDVLVRKERELVDRIDKFTEFRVQELESYRQNQETELQVEQQRYELTDRAVTSDCVSEMFGIYESVDEASRDEDGIMDRRPLSSSSSNTFVHDTEKLIRSVEEVQLGEVKVVGGFSDWTTFPFLKETHEVCSGRRNRGLRDVVVFVVNGIRIITVTDYLKDQLSMLYVPKTPSLKNHLELPSGPTGIAKLDGTKAAVALPDTQQIAFIKFDPEPTLQSAVKTKREYGCLAFLNPAQLVAGTFDCPASVDILDMEGNVLKSINTGNIRNPCYIQVTRNNNVIVSEGAVQSLVSVTVDGQTVFTFTPRGDIALQCPQGITTTSTGDILLVDEYLNKVIQLTQSGQFVRDVLTAFEGIWDPIGICLDEDGLLYVTTDGYVKVFDCE